MGGAEAAGPIRVQVVFSPQAGTVDEVALSLPAGATAADAVLASGLAERHRERWPDPLRVGVWGRRVAPSHGLVDGDRVEIYRALRVDPKEARRQRYRASHVKARNPSR